MSLAARQAFLARFLTDPATEKRVRSQPELVAAELQLAPEFVRRVAAIAPERVRSFRRSRVVKAERRGD
ncbi:MAG: hypothetical protein JJ863_08075 [Deltaproteobacteria bacterium]|nr:hypothetical protein [Deltaproteobacteria bacterium]